MTIKFKKKSLQKWSWNAAIVVLTAMLELWVVVLLILFGEQNKLLFSLVIANLLNFCSTIYALGMLTKIVYDKLFAKEDLTGYLALGKDFYPPMPKWEWNDPPLFWNVCDYSQELGWAQIYPRPEDRMSQEVKIGFDDCNESLKLLQELLDPELVEDENFVKYLDPGAIRPTTLNYYERHYFKTASLNEQPTVVVCICYLLSKGSNDFLMDSLRFFTQVHSAPIYVMINAREEGDWVNTQLEILSKFLVDNCFYQIKLFFVKYSRSKAANLNAFIDVLPSPNECKYKYVLNYDVDDRPTFNEKSLLAYAEGVVGKMRAGNKIVGIQGPCLECFNNTYSGFLEAMLEYNAQAAAGTSNWESRFLGKIKSQGSNHLVLTEVFRCHKFNVNVLLEDWRWTSNMLQDDKCCLAFARTMVCYGQTPLGWNAVAKRRNRWVKGRFQESFHDAFYRPVFGTMFWDWARGWMAILSFFVLKPIYHALIVFGYDAIFSESGRQGRYGLLIPEVLKSEGISPCLGVLWNFLWPISTLFVVGHYFANFVCVVSNPKSSSFLNGRDSFQYRVLYVVMHFLDFLLFATMPFTRNFQYVYFCRAEWLLEKALGRKAQWVPTPKMTSQNVSKSMHSETNHTVDCVGVSDNSSDNYSS